MLVIFVLLTPGALRSSMDWRMPSNSATAEDMVARQTMLMLYLRATTGLRKLLDVWSSST